MVRATWFIKLSSAYAVAVTEAKMKKRQVPDPAQGENFTVTFLNSDFNLMKIIGWLH